MRFLGFVFVLALLLAVVGYWRGWFSVVNVHAGGKNDLTLGVDNDRIGDDTRAAVARLEQLSAKAAEAVKSLGRKVGPEERELEGTLTAVDPVAHDLTVTASSRTIDLHVPLGVPIMRDGKSVGFAHLHPAVRVKLSFQYTVDDQKLSRIEILQ